MNIRLLAFAFVLTAAPVLAAMPPLVSGTEYSFDGFLVIRNAETDAKPTVLLTAMPGGDAPRGFAGRQDIELKATRGMTAAKILSTARDLGPEKKVTVKGVGAPKNSLKVETITAKVQARPVVKMLRVSVENVELEGDTLVLTCMADGCTTEKQLEVRTSAAGEEAKLWIERPDRGPCMLAVMPSPMTLRVDLAKTFPGASRLSVTVESLGNESFQIDWEKP